MPCCNNGGPDERDCAVAYMRAIWPLLSQEIKDSLPKTNNPIGDVCLVCRILSKEQISAVKNSYFEWASESLLYWYADHLVKDFQNKESSQQERDFAKKELKRIGFKLTPYIKPEGFRVGDFMVIKL